MDLRYARVLGAGGFGAVALVVDHHSQEPFALKMLRRSGGDGAGGAAAAGGGGGERTRMMHREWSEETHAHEARLQKVLTRSKRVVAMQTYHVCPTGQVDETPPPCAIEKPTDDGRDLTTRDVLFLKRSHVISSRVLLRARCSCST